MNSEHSMLTVNPKSQEVYCTCGHIMHIGNLKHLALHNAEPSPSELQKAWRQAISYRNHLPNTFSKPDAE